MHNTSTQTHAHKQNTTKGYCCTTCIEFGADFSAIFQYYHSCASVLFFCSFPRPVFTAIFFAYAAAYATVSCATSVTSSYAAAYRIRYGIMLLHALPCFWQRSAVPRV